MKKSRICWIRILFPVLSVLLFSIFLLTIKVNAASDQDYFPMDQNGNNLFTETLMNALDSNLDSENNYVFVKYGFQDGAFTNFYYISIPKNSDNYIYAEKYNNLYQFSLYFANPNNVRAYRINFLSDGTRGGIYEASLNEFTGCYSSNYSNSVSYVSNFQVYTNSNSSTRKIVLLYGDQEPIIPDDDTIPEDSEKPSFSDYVPDWSNAPSFDNSSVEAALNSVFSIIQWLGNNIKDTIIGTGKFVADTVLWGMQMIINNIRGKLQELKESIEDIVSGFGDLIDSKFGNIITIASTFFALGLDQAGNFSLTQMFTSLFVPSSQLVIQAVIEHDDFDFIGTSKVVLSDAPRILSQLYNVTPSPVFHVPSCTFHGVEIGNFDISFSWFAPYKVYYDVIVSTFLVIGWIYWFYLSFGSHLKGSNIIDFSGDDSYHRNNIGF